MYVIRRIVAFAAVFSIFLLSGFWRAGEIIDPEIAERYGTDERIAEALRNFNASEKAELIASKNTEEAIVSLTFDGLNDLDVMEAVIAITKRYNIKATFFVPGVEVAEYGNIVTSLKEAGHEIGSYTLYGTSHMQEFPARELIRNFIYSSVIIEDALGEAPGYLKCRNTEYTERVLYAASVSGFGHVVRSDYNLSFQSFKEYKDAQNYINRLPKGSIVSVKMRGVLEPGEFTPSATPSPTPEIHLLPSEVPRPEETPQIQLSETERLLNVVEWLCRAVYESEREVLFVKDLPFARLAEDGGIQGNSETERLAEETRPAKARNLGQERAAQQKAEAQRRLEEQKRIDAFWLETVASLRDANAGKLAKEINMVYTTERAASFVFYGIINGEAFEDTLRTLDALGISGTFFVSDEDIEQHPERIDAIIQSGNELGIAYLPKSDRDFDAAALNIIKTSQLLNDRYGISAKLVKQPFSSISDDLREVVSMMGLTLVNHGVSVVRSDDEYEVSADNIVKKALYRR